MPDLLLASLEYSGYISPVKLLLFLALFLAWLPLLTWVYRDATAVGTNEALWTGVILGTGAVAAIIWLLLPIFLIGMALYVIAVAVASVSYVLHRNSKVMNSDRILTAEHVRSLFADEQKKLDALEDLLFITANNNEVPMPQPKTPDFNGYKASYEIFTDAIWRRASDIAFVPTQQNYDVTYYVDGTSLKQPSLAREQTEDFIRFVKNLADMNVDEKRKPQRGNFSVSRHKERIEWKVATAGSTAGEEIRLKQMTKHDMTKLSDLSLPPAQYKQLSGVTEVSKGLFIISGPRKSGVTSTFYAMLRSHDAFLNSINTLERQISAELPNITQTPYTLSDTGTTTYAKKLQMIIRMGSNIVGVADCRDSETAQVACAGAKQGKLVYLVLEAENVVQALGKWVRLAGNRSLAVEPLLGISSQRLIRKLCEECKQAYEPNTELLKKFNLPAEKAKVLYRAGKEVYDKHGKARTCENCQGTGFVGRMGLFEIIIMNDELKKAVMQSKSLSEISARFRAAKMLYLQERALKKAMEGTTAINEVIRVLAASKKTKVKKPRQ